MGIPILGKCPHCNHVLSAESQVTDDQVQEEPKDGDVSVCFYCGKFIIFGDGQRHRMSESEFNDLPENVRGELVYNRNLVLRRIKGTLH